MGYTFREVSHLIGKKWTIPILEEIALSGFDGFNKFIQRNVPITSAVLSQELKELEAARIIARVASHETSDSTRYILTDRGGELYGILQMLKEWAEPPNEFPVPGVGPRKSDGAVTG